MSKGTQACSPHGAVSGARFHDLDGRQSRLHAMPAASTILGALMNSK